MKRFPLGLILALPVLMANDDCNDPARIQEEAAVARQQSVYANSQPIPTFDYSLERDRTIGLYRARQTAAQTFSVWRSYTGQIEGDCASSGYPLPYGVQLSNPSQRVGVTDLALPQPEPNGLFTDSLSTDGTWVFCVVAGGKIAPVYVEDAVTVYPYPIEVDYETGRVRRTGEPTVILAK